MSKKVLNIAVLGLEGGGKSSIASTLMLDTPIPNVSDQQVLFTIKMKGTKLELNDYRGSIPAQKLLWPKAIQDADGIIWVVDADKEKLFSQSAELLKTTLGGRSLPILIYANKMDIPSAQPESKIKPYFAEFSNCFVQSASVVNFDGLWEGIGWLTKAVKAAIKANKKKK